MRLWSSCHVIMYEALIKTKIIRALFEANFTRELHVFVYIVCAQSRQNGYLLLAGTLSE